jgi:hypothetical protein
MNILKNHDNEKPESLSRSQGHTDRIRNPVYLPFMHSREYHRQQFAKGPFQTCTECFLPQLPLPRHRSDTRPGRLKKTGYPITGTRKTLLFPADAMFSPDGKSPSAGHEAMKRAP